MTRVPLVALVAAGLCLRLAAAAEGDFIGCFEDRESMGDLNPRTKAVPEKLDLAFCIAHCKVTNGGPYRYTGLLNGDTCLCGDSYGRWGQANRCDARCTGDTQPTGKCGGKNAISVYETGSSKAAVHERVFQSLTARNTFTTLGDGDPRRRGGGGGGVAAGADTVGVVFSSERVGCYKDKSPGRAFKDGPHDEDELTPDVCLKRCTEPGSDFTHFAVQDGNQCFCGTDAGNQYGESDKCTKFCSGDSTKTCGGPFANEVYKIVKTLPPPPPSTPFFLNCGIPGAVLIVFLLVTATSIGGHGFFATMVVAGIHTRAPQSIFLGALLGQCFLLTISGLLGHILPDSNALSVHNARLVAIVLTACLGMAQVQRSFVVAAKDQDDRCDEFRGAVVELSRAGGRDPESGTKDEGARGVHAMYVGFKTSLCADWGGLSQLGIIGMACTIDLTSVFYGGMIAKLYVTSLAASCTQTSQLGRNSMALKMHFLAGLLYFLLSMHSLLEISDSPR